MKAVNIKKTNSMKNKEIKIEKNVPLPSKGTRGNPKFPFSDMSVGDSFYVPLRSGKKIQSLQAQMHSNSRSFILNNKKFDWKFKTSSDKKGVRIWRVK